ncbi:hypothetical protein DFS34DRAFT_659789 [Phlyctochytrium arcticum]|nr:hypothetical protein DFS34DRAFT_659789 [Phlyctochytrium arcticum]
MSTSSRSAFGQSLAVHLDPPVTSLSISPDGQNVVLAAGLYIVDLDDPYRSPTGIHHMTNWEVSDVQWNPHKSRRNWIATTSNQKVLVWNLDAVGGAQGSTKHVEHILGTHQRAVSDLNWSPFHPTLLATCSYDTYVHLWDLRKSSEKPANSFCAWTAGATQVKFNRLNEHLVASSHDTDVKIWDARKGSTPVTLIMAHMTKIYGIDWSRNNADEIITCSQDKLVKFWDITSPRTCQATITTSSPVWRARFTPFGNGVVTMPQRRDTNLLMWNCDNPTSPVYSFEGHADVPREFVWRVRGGDDGDESAYQLVTWSKDQTLRLWAIESDLMKEVGHEPLEIIPNVRLLRKSSLNDISIPVARRKLSADLRGPLSSNDVLDLPTQIQNTPSETYRMGMRKPSEAERRTSETSVSRQGSIGNEFLLERPGWESPLPMPDEVVPPSTLEEEIAYVAKHCGSARFEKVNLLQRTCTVTLQRGIEAQVQHSAAVTTPSAFIRLDISFPARYPDRALPTFVIHKTGMISLAERTYLSKKVAHIAALQVHKGLRCLHPCIKFLLAGTTTNAEITSLPAALSDEVRGGGYRTLSRTSSGIVAGSMSGDEHGTTFAEKDLPATTNMLSSSADDASETTTSSDAGGISLLAGRVKKRVRDKRLLKEVIVGKDNNNVPFPRLCGASFSPTGKLVYFFSPLPHPSATKFTAYSLITRNQQPVLQSQHFNTQPKTYPLYENYRAFVLARFPRMFMASGNITEPPALDGLGVDAVELDLPGGPNDTSKLNYWLDSDESGEESSAPSLFWRPKPGGSLQPALFSSADFLARMHQHPNSSKSSNTASPSVPHSSIAPEFVVPTTPKASAPTPHSDKHARRNLQVNPSASKYGDTHAVTQTPSADASASLSSHSMRGFGLVSAPLMSDTLPMIARVGDESRLGTQSPLRHPSHEYLDIVTPFKSVAPLHDSESDSRSDHNPGKLGSTVNSQSNRAAEKPLLYGQPTSGIDLLALTETAPTSPTEPTSEFLGSDARNSEETNYGTIVRVTDITGLLPVSESLAQEYTLRGDDPVAICTANCAAAKRANRRDLVQVWTLAAVLIGHKLEPPTLNRTSKRPPRRNRRRHIPQSVGHHKDHTHITREGQVVLRSGMSGRSNDHREQLGVWHERVASMSQLGPGHPFGRKMLQDLFVYLEEVGDVQTLALLACVLAPANNIDRNAALGHTRRASAANMQVERLNQALQTPAPDTSYFQYNPASAAMTTPGSTNSVTSMLAEIVTPSLTSAFSRMGVAVSNLAADPTTGTVALQLTSSAREGMALPTLRPTLSDAVMTSRLNESYHHSLHDVGQSVAPTAPSPGVHTQVYGQNPTQSQLGTSYASDSGLNMYLENRSEVPTGVATSSGQLTPTYAQALSGAAVTSPTTKSGPTRRNTNNSVGGPLTSASSQHLRAQQATSPVTTRSRNSESNVLREGGSSRSQSPSRISSSNLGWTLTAPLSSVAGPFTGSRTISNDGFPQLSSLPTTQANPSSPAVLILKLTDDRDADMCRSSNRNSPLLPNSPNLGFLDPNKTAVYDRYKLSYAEMLYQWGLLEQRAEVLKFVSSGAGVLNQQHAGIGLF